MSEPTPFGAPMLQHFQFDPSFKNLNHGSFGAHPKQIQTVNHTFQTACEARPDPFIRYEQPHALDTARTAIANYVHAPVQDCVFVKNATTGINVVLRNLVFNPDDVIVYFGTVYGAVEKTIISLTETTSVTARKITYDFPISHEQLLAKFRDAVAGIRANGKNAKVAIFDTVVSSPGFRFPFENLVAACRELDVLSLVDGAHGVGMIPLDLGRLKPDFFTSNCHKWLYTPRSSALLYVPQKNQHLIRTTLPTSWGFIPAATTTPSSTTPLTHQDTSKTAFEQLFEFVATADDAPYLCVPAAVEFRGKVCGGEESVWGYLEELAGVGGNVVAEMLGTEVLQESGVSGWRESRMRRCAMVNVRLPVRIGSGEEELKEDELTGVFRWLGEVLIRKYGTFVPVFRLGDALWTRLSAQIYLEKGDFVWLAGVLKEVCEYIRKREMD